MKHLLFLFLPFPLFSQIPQPGNKVLFPSRIDTIPAVLLISECEDFCVPRVIKGYVVRESFTTFEDGKKLRTKITAYLDHRKLLINPPRRVWQVQYLK